MDNIYYAIVAPRSDLFAEPTYQEIARSDFGCFNIHVARFGQKTTLNELKGKITRKWQEEAKKTPELETPLKNALVVLQNAVHAYLIFEDTAKMFLSFRKGYLEKDLPTSFKCPVFAYYQAFKAISSVGTYVQILTEGRAAWENDSDQRLQICSRMISEDNMIYERLSPKVISFWQQKEQRVQKNLELLEQRKKKKRS